jgi:hypothetical protein
LSEENCWESEAGCLPAAAAAEEERGGVPATATAAAAATATVDVGPSASQESTDSSEAEQGSTDSNEAESCEFSPIEDEWEVDFSHGDFCVSIQVGMDVAAAAAAAAEEATAAECPRLLERGTAKRRQREDAAAAVAEEGLRRARAWTTRRDRGAGSRRQALHLRSGEVDIDRTQIGKAVGFFGKSVCVP